MIKIKLKVIAFTFFIISTISTNSQTLILNDSIHLKKGIYLDFLEFKYNCPSLPLNSDIWNYSRSFGFLFRTKIDYYFINIHSKLINRVGNVFGFCDGTNFYLKSEVSTGEDEYGFVKIDEVGPLCYFEDFNFSNSSNSSNKLNFVKVELTKNIIDLSSGNIYEINSKNIFEYIINDKTLTEEFSKLKHKERYIKNCILKYNQRNREQYIKQISENEIQIEYNQHFKFMEYISSDSLLYKTSDENYDLYFERMKDHLNHHKIIYISKVEDFYRTGVIKIQGIESKHYLDNNGKYIYKIGTWNYYKKDGSLKKSINRNLWGIIENKNS